MAKFKEKQKKINARLVTVTEVINLGIGLFGQPHLQTVSPGQYIIEEDDGTFITTSHGSEFNKKYDTA